MSVKAESIFQFYHRIISLGVNLHPRETFDDQVILGEGASLIKAADVDLACEGDPKRLSAENGFLDKLNDRVVNGHGELHRELGRNNIGYNQDTSEKKLLSASIGVLQPLS